MAIKLISGYLNELQKQLKEVEKLEDSESEKNLDEGTVNNILNILGDSGFKKLCERCKDIKYYNNLTYSDLNEMADILFNVSSAINQTKEAFDINVFLKDGYVLSKEKIEKQFRNNKAERRNPNFNIDRLIDLYKNPPKTLKTYYNEDVILIDSYVYRKYLTAIIQMVLDDMDLLLCFVGGEGTGKSTKVSQDMYLVYWTLKELGLIDYDFDINEIFVNSLKKFSELEDKYFGKRFRLLGLDEGNELNRNNWRDERVQEFFLRLRRERHEQRIKFVSLPVLGELLPALITTRVNFIFEMETRNDLKTGRLKKGYVNFYIVPRGNKIYSPHYRKEISRDVIKTVLHENLKDRSYLKGVPKSILIKQFRCNGTWGFKEEEYLKELKETNRSFTLSKGLKLSETEMFMLYKSGWTLKQLEITKTDIKYHSIAKVISKINNYFENDPDKMLKYDAMYQRKLEAKESRDKSKDKKREPEKIVKEESKPKRKGFSKKKVKEFWDKPEEKEDSHLDMIAGKLKKAEGFLK